MRSLKEARKEGFPTESNESESQEMLSHYIFDRRLYLLCVALVSIPCSNTSSEIWNIIPTTNTSGRLESRENRMADHSLFQTTQHRHASLTQPQTIAPHPPQG